MTLAQKLASARTDAAVGPVEARGVVHITGKGGRDFLHRMSTQHLSALPTGGSAYAAFLDGRGHIVGEGLVVARAEDLLLGIDVVGRYLGYFLFLFRDDRLDRGDGATCHFDVDHVGTDLMDRNIETNLLAVNLDAAGITDCFGNFLGRD